MNGLSFQKANSVAQLAEAVDLGSTCCGFDSHPGYCLGNGVQHCEMQGKVIHLKQWEGSSSIDIYARAPLVGTGAK